MEILTDDALAEFDKELETSMSGDGAQAAIAGIDSDFLCNNKEAVLGFIKMLVDFIPGFAGKIVGKLVIRAAEKWFERHCD
jgi:hypothetical protein